MYKVIVAGSRDFNNYELLKEKLDLYLQNKESVEIISGGARGADRLGERYARESGKVCTLSRMEAQWNRYGKSAGAIRNRQMGDVADALVLFWDGSSPGSKDMLGVALDKGLDVRIVRYNE